MAEQPADADVAQLVERNLAKVEVAGSNLVIRSNLTKPLPPGEAAFVVYATFVPCPAITVPHTASHYLQRLVSACSYGW